VEKNCLSFQGWAAAGSTSRGGKPFFLGRLDPAEHCIFFDDHISPLDPKIVEPGIATQVMASCRFE